MSNTKLSFTLSTLASSHPPETFHCLLARGVYPVLDALPATIRYKIEANLKALQWEILKPISHIGNGYGPGLEAQIGDEEQGLTHRLELIGVFERRPTVQNYKELIIHCAGNAQIYLEKGLGTALLTLQGEIHEDYPDLDKALVHLEGKFEALKLPRRFNFDTTLTALEVHWKREEVFSRFVKLAQHYHTEGKAPGHRVRIKAEHRDVNTADEIRGWATILDNWPNKVQVKKIRLNLGIRTNDPFYGIDGVARVLAENSVCNNVAESITAAYDGFGPKSCPNAMHE